MSPVTPDQLAKYRREFPDLPEEYFNYLLSYGAGQALSGRIFYSGPVFPDEVFPGLELERIVLLGDDGQGYCFGYDLEKRQFGELSAEGIWNPANKMPIEFGVASKPIP